MVGTVTNTLLASDGRTVVEVRGEIDVANAERLSNALTGAARQRPVALVVDLLYVTFIDSTGIGALAAGYNASHRIGVPFSLRGPSAFIASQLRQTGLADVLAVED